MKKFFLIGEFSILDQCMAKSITSAQLEFNMRGWVIGEVWLASEVTNYK